MCSYLDYYQPCVFCALKKYPVVSSFLQCSKTDHIAIVKIIDHRWINSFRAVIEMIVWGCVHILLRTRFDRLRVRWNSVARRGTAAVDVSWTHEHVEVAATAARMISVVPSITQGRSSPFSISHSRRSRSIISTHLRTASSHESFPVRRHRLLIGWKAVPLPQMITVSIPDRHMWYFPQPSRSG